LHARKLIQSPKTTVAKTGQIPECFQHGIAPLSTEFWIVTSASFSRLFFPVCDLHQLPEKTYETVIFLIATCRVFLIVQQFFEHKHNG